MVCEINSNIILKLIESHKMTERDHNAEMGEESHM